MHWKTKLICTLHCVCFFIQKCQLPDVKYCNFYTHFAAENRLKKLKGQSSDVTSRDMLRSLSQAKKECWDRFLHDAQTSELFQGGDMDER